MPILTLLVGLFFAFATTGDRVTPMPSKSDQSGAEYIILDDEKP